MDNLHIDDDFVLSAGPGYSAAMCAKCGEIKPSAEFKRKLTKAQSRARGYAGNVALEIESSMCKSCQPRLKDVQHLNARELHNRVSVGDLSPVIAKALKDKRDKEARAAMRAAAKRAWDNVRTQPWATPIGNAQTELTRLRQQEKYVKTTLNSTTIEIDLTFFVEYKLLLTATVARMKFEKMRTCKEPPFLDWQGFVDMTVFHRLLTLWEELPLVYRQRVKPPALFSVRPGEARECPPVNSLRTGPSAADRLAQGRPKPERVPQAEPRKTAMPPSEEIDWDNF